MPRHYRRYNRGRRYREHNNVWNSDFSNGEVTLPNTTGQHVYTPLFALQPSVEVSDTVISRTPWESTLQRIRGDFFLDAQTAVGAAARIILFGAVMSQQRWNDLSAATMVGTPPDPEQSGEGNDYPLWIPIACVDPSSRINPGQLPIDNKAKRKMEIGTVIGCFLKSTRLSGSTTFKFDYGLLLRCLWQLRK